jgi:hypothetical protein
MFMMGGCFLTVFLDWLVPGYYVGVFSNANQGSDVLQTALHTAGFQSLMLGLFVGVMVVVGTGWFGQCQWVLNLSTCAVLAGCAVAFAVGGGLIGFALGGLLPGYYRTMFRGGWHPDFNPVDVGVGLGTSQGAILGAIVGGMVVVALAWRRSTSRPTLDTETSPFSPAPQ